MTINGHVENGKIVLDESVPLTDGMKVRIELLDAVATKNGGEEDKVAEFAPTFYERHKAWFGSVKDAPPDYASNHDHYLHGQPKK